MKIRSDFVTNSSSSSFMLVIRIGLKNGKVLKFMGDGGVGENSEEYYELTANASPEELGQCESIDELIRLLQRSVVQGWDTYYGEDEEPDEKVIEDYEEIIEGLKELNSMDEIATITINGDLFGRGEQYQYKHYTYYRDKKVTVYDEGGDEYINDEGTGGHIAFYGSGKWKKAEGFGNTEVDEYEYFDDDVYLPAKGKSKTNKDEKGSQFVIKGDGVLSKYKGKDKNIIIPETVKSIGEEAFSYSNIESIVIQEGVVSIGGAAFAGCKELKKVIVPNSMTEVEGSAFSGCSNLKDIDLPDSVEYIGDFAFTKTGIDHIMVPKGIDEIGESTYSDCMNLEKVVIPDHILRIGDCAFTDCENLTEVILPDTITSIGDIAFLRCGKLEKINIPQSITSLEADVFKDCVKLTVTVIKGSYAEEYCKNVGLKYVYG